MTSSEMVFLLRMMLDDNFTQTTKQFSKDLHVADNFWQQDDLFSALTEAQEQLITELVSKKAWSMLRGAVVTDTLGNEDIPLYGVHSGLAVRNVAGGHLTLRNYDEFRSYQGVSSIPGFQQATFYNGRIYLNPSNLQVEFTYIMEVPDIDPITDSLLSPLAHPLVVQLAKNICLRKDTRAAQQDLNSRFGPSIPERTIFAGGRLYPSEPRPQQ